MSLFLKDASVCIADPSHALDAHLMFALGVAMQTFGLCQKDCIITSACDGHHNPGSLHSLGCAVDLRTLNLTTSQREQIFRELQSTLSPLGFDVIWESAPGTTPATTAAHIHIEYDPRGRAFWKLAGTVAGLEKE